MATLSTKELAEVRQFAERKARQFGVPVTWDKPTINAALQMIEDVLSGGRLIQKGEIADTGTPFPSYLSARIDEATAPFTFGNAAKIALVAKVLELKFRRDR